MRLTETLPIYLIDNPRGSWMRGQLAGELAAVSGATLHTIPPIMPDALPKSACGALAREETWSRADALAPFLGHLTAWERIADETSPALLIESMVELRGLPALRRLTLPVDADIIFVGDRMMLKPDEQTDFDQPASFRAVPMIEVMALVDAVPSGPAADAYLITPAGAAKLVAACAEDGLYGFVGGRLVQYATTDADLAPFAPGTRAVSVARRHRHPKTPPKFGIVRAYGVTPAPLPTRKPRYAMDPQPATTPAEPARA